MSVLIGLWVVGAGALGYIPRSWRTTVFTLFAFAVAVLKLR